MTTRSITWVLLVYVSGYLISGQEILGAQTSKTAAVTTSSRGMSHEETVVRTAYARLSYAVEQAAVGRLAMEANGVPVQKADIGVSESQRLAAAQVSFALKDFSFGQISDILDRKAIDLITPASGEFLTADGNRGMNYSEPGLETSWRCIELQWRKVQRPLPAEAADITIDDLYRLQWHQQRPDTLWQRYASFVVTVSYQGRTRGPYRALFLFGHDSQGNEVVEPEDGTTNAGALVAALHEQLFPDAFLSSRLRNVPAISNWVSGKQMSDTGCGSGQHDLCCDLASVRCGLAQDDVVNRFGKPLPIGPKQ